CTLGNNDNSFILSFDLNDEIFRDIKLPENYLDGLGPNSDHHLFGCTNSGEFLVQMFDRRLVSLDTENLKVNHLGIQIPFWLYYTADLMESLVLLDQVKSPSEYHD
ncbi:hypothetical protein CFP56_006714, partial [Quercus suber]